MVANIDLLKEIMQDADPLLFIKKGADPDVYDGCAFYIESFLSKDLSISQIEGIIWWSLYEESCSCTYHLTNSPLILTPEEGMLIVGEPKRFNSIAHEIRHQILSL